VPGRRTVVITEGPLTLLGEPQPYTLMPPGRASVPRQVLPVLALIRPAAVLAMSSHDRGAGATDEQRLPVLQCEVRDFPGPVLDQPASAIEDVASWPPTRRGPGAVGETGGSPCRSRATPMPLPGLIPSSGFAALTGPFGCPAGALHCVDCQA
jgi:hypothetical protein